MLWEVKTDNFDMYTADLQKIVLGKQVQELQRERGIARACGFGFRVTLSGWERPANLGPGGQPLFEVHAELPLDSAGLSAAADVLEGLAEGSRAFWGRATPDSATLGIAHQTAPTVEGLPCPPRGLPALKLF